jgi:phospholipid/cholesterol/gamma-HCH transport system substrate-binding protein
METRMSSPSSLSNGKTIGQNNAAEVMIGLGVVVLAILALAFFYMGGSSGSASGYSIKAQLAKVDGLGIGTDVRISGIKVGTVSSLALNPVNYLVLVTMDINKGVEIPTDSSLQVTSSGILGGQYISIQPGGDDKVLASGGMIENAQGSADLMSMIGHFALGGTGASSPAPATPAPATPAPGAAKALPDGP